MKTEARRSVRVSVCENSEGGGVRQQRASERV